MEWISVKERIPELRDANILAHFSSGCIQTVHIEDWFSKITAGLDENGKQKYTHWYLCTDPTITHWMPLPEPPNE